MTGKHLMIASSGTPSTPTAREELIRLMALDSSGRVAGLSESADAHTRGGRGAGMALPARATSAAMRGLSMQSVR